jgi:WD40 repeat protein
MAIPAKRVVLWSPHRTDCYAVIGGTQLEVFEKQERLLVDSSVIPSPAVDADWCGAPNLESTIAIGLATGTVSLIDIGTGKPSVQQLSLRRKRPCSALAFAPGSPLLAEALRERNRDEPGVIIWDVSTGKPTHELGNLDAAASVDWVSGSSSLLVSGSIKSWLRLYDLRAPQPDAAAAAAIAAPREVRAVACDRHCDWRVASADGEEPVVKLWDTRRLKAPVATLATRGPAAALAWAPDRDDALAVLCAGDLVVSLWDVRAGRAVRAAAAPAPVASFALHPREPDRVLLATAEGPVADVVLRPRLPITFSCTGALATAASGVVRTADLCPTDVLAAMRSRAARGYGMDARVNATVAAEDGQHELAFVWNWVDRSLSGLPADGARILQVRDLHTYFLFLLHGLKSGG